jgi:alanyl-tRNA synthetase
VVPSSSLIPWDDPTLLFTNAGMNQFKDVFLGTGTRPYTRAVNAQKCMRAGGKHNDLEDVGKSPRHQTFFEMLGNWSFGDYYKREAITWAWELLTGVWNLPGERLWASVFRDDDEAETLWRECTGIGRDRILRFDEKDNFWEMGDTGPCGPCSEIHIDLGPERCGMQGTPHRCGVNGDCGRYWEFWNLVFIQYNRDAAGALSLLPAKHVDTGMGFERMVCILQNARSNYDTDVFRPLLTRIGDLSGQPYDEGEKGMAFRVLADHVRALTFAITDGELPSNEGRGYVLRRILRRAARYCRVLDQHEPFLHRLVPTVVEIMGDAYPEIREARERVERVIRSEEEAFGRTLDRGLEHFGEIAGRLMAEGRREISGAEAFRLYDTYGFPVDLTRLLAEEQGVTVDLAGFEREMDRQRSRSKTGAAVGGAADTPAFRTAPALADPGGAHSEFVGYRTFEVPDAVVVASDGASVVLSRTPFYAESGGQVGDTGWLVTAQGDPYRIVDTVKQGGVILHRRDPADARPLAPGTAVSARVDADRRRAVMRNHTATHLLHAALRAVLGVHVHQRGSEVAPDRLRFDFSHVSPVGPEELDAVERMVNERIWEDLPVDWFETSLAEAKAAGAMALFTEKYGERVRVVRIDGVSLELCGGTHLRATGEIGSFRLVRESGVAAGERRLEAVTGEAAYRAMKEDIRTLREVAAALRSDPGEVVRRAEALQERVRELEREIRRLSSQTARGWLEDMLSRATQTDGVTVAAARVDSVDVDTLRAMGDTVRERLPGAAVGVLFAVVDERPLSITVVTDAAISAYRLHAGSLARDIAALMGGGGGGKAHMAQAGGKDPSRINDALARVPEVVRAHLKS